MNTLHLHKPRDHFIVRYEPGDEGKALDALVAWVNTPGLGFGWLDAAVMSTQIGRELAKEVKGIGVVK